MFDFLQISQQIKKGVIEIYPKFIYKKSRDLMIRGGDFYAIWDNEAGLWSKDEDWAIKLIDKELDEYFKEHKEEFTSPARVLHLWDTDTGMIDKWHKYVQKQLTDNYHSLDEKIIFANTEVKKEDYVSKRLPYSIAEGDTSAYDQLMSILYSPEERRKLEWAIGAIISGDSKTIQKFIVMYGDRGTGKSTVLNIVQDLFDGYYSSFDAKALGLANASFALEPFKDNPLVAIQHDGDLSRIEDNTRLNSICSHELMTVNEKFKSAYTARFNTFIFMGTNRPVKITDSRSGILRRLIDVSPTGTKIPRKTYNDLVARIKFELGAIAKHCLDVYEEDPSIYDDYIPVNMMGASNDFYNYVEDNADILSEGQGITLNAAWDLYKIYCSESNVLYPYSKRVFKEELKNYFENYHERITLDDGTRVRNYFEGFIADKFIYNTPKEIKRGERSWLVFTEPSETTIFDRVFMDCQAQYANDKENPKREWDSVKTSLRNVDPRKLHYVRLPENYICIDFDLKDRDGNKSLKKNLEAARLWPKTYAELSKSGEGIHLIYKYDGDITRLEKLYSKDIEIKTFFGKSALRRKLTKCCDLDIALISSGLPLKKEMKMLNYESLKSERAIRKRIADCIEKKHHGATKPEVDFIFKTLEDSYNSGINYDVSDLKPAIISFAAKSSHQAEQCMKIVSKMHFASDEISESVSSYDKGEIIFFDVEVFPNLFVVCYKATGKNPVKLINPSPIEIEELIKHKLVGFNNRRYDNHILYARMMGYTNQMLYELSRRIIDGHKDGFIGEAYNLSYTDIYDFASTKQGLKKWEIELDLHHQELDLAWDKPVDKLLWDKVAEYCINDVIATEAVFYARQEDFTAREILSDISGLSVNDTTNQHTTTIIFGRDKNPQEKFIYTDLATGRRSDFTIDPICFPGYKFENGKSTYRGEEVGEGGYVYAEPGIYYDIALLDIASMHPTSIEQLGLFGPYTERFSDIKKARILIKHGDYEEAGKMFDGKLKPYLTNKESAEKLAYALKIAINSVYGLTAASFPNKCRDPRNIDNIVAKRGALFMVDLKHAVQEKGFTVAHIKTDSIKIPNATKEIIDFVMEFGKKYGYVFEHEATYDRMCLVNDAVYIAKYKGGKHDGEWTATGTQFQVPYVFKKLFSHEEIVFKDLCETKTVTSALYLDFNENLKEDEHQYTFIGRAGLFCPIKPGFNGGLLLREKDGKYNAATGTKGYRWKEAEEVKKNKLYSEIDESYYQRLTDDAIASISEYGDFASFVS